MFFQKCRVVILQVIEATNKIIVLIDNRRIIHARVLRARQHLIISAPKFFVVRRTDKSVVSTGVG